MVHYFPILIWQTWTKHWTKVVIRVNLDHIKLTSKGNASRSTLKIDVNKMYTRY